MAQRNHLVVLGLVLAAGSAEAAEPKVGVVPFQHLQPELPRELGEQTTLVVSREIEHGGITVERVAGLEAPAAAGSPSDAPTGDPRAANRAERLLAEAQDMLADGSVPAAAKRLDQAVQLLEANADAVADLRTLAEAHLQLAIAMFRDGQEEEADDALARSVHLDPERTLDPARFPPIFVRVFDRARYAVLRRPRGDVEVKATPGARVLLDGRAMGQAPLLLQEVLPGRHVIRIERAGEAVQVKTLTVASKKTTAVVFDGGEGASRSEDGGVLGALSANALDAGQLRALQTAGRAARADFLLVGVMFGTDTAYQIRSALLDVRTGQIGRVQDVAFDLDLLSAEIEVFKLAQDVQRQSRAGALSSPEAGPGFVPAPDFKPVRRSGPRVGSVRAAPPPPPEPKSIHATAPATAAPVVRPKSTLVPKDEQPAAAAAAPSVVTRTARPEKEEGEGLWWLWVVVGVAAVGAASAVAAVALADQGGPEQGTLVVRW